MENSLSSDSPHFGKPVSSELVYEFEFEQLNTKKESDLGLLYHLTKEAMSKAGKASLDDFYSHKKVLNKFVISQLLVSDPVLDAVRRTMKKIYPEVKCVNEEIEKIIMEEIIKRDVLDDERNSSAKRAVTKALNSAKKPEKTPDLPTE